MLSGSCTYGFTLPRINEMINRNVDSDRRATALSTLTLLGSALFIPVSSVIGWTSDHFSIQTALFAVAGWLILTGSCLLLLKTALLKKPR
jgi:hypothetical protein